MVQRINFEILTNLGNMADPVQTMDAATKNYVDTNTTKAFIGTASPNTTNPTGSKVGDLYVQSDATPPTKIVDIWYKTSNATNPWIVVEDLVTSRLDQLTDVNVVEAAAINGLPLIYDNTTSKWVARKDNLTNLGDVNIGTGTNTYTQLFKTDGTAPVVIFASGSPGGIPAMVAYLSSTAAASISAGTVLTASNSDTAKGFIVTTITLRSGFTDLYDINFSNAVAGDAWIPATPSAQNPGALYIRVSSSAGPANNDALVYDSTSSKWVNRLLTLEGLEDVQLRKWFELGRITGYTYTGTNTYPATITLSSLSSITVNANDIVTLIPQVADDVATTGIDATVTAVSGNTLTLAAPANTTFWNNSALVGRLVYVSKAITTAGFGDVIISEDSTQSKWRVVPPTVLSRPQSSASNWSGNANLLDMQQRIQTRGVVVGSSMGVESPTGTVNANFSTTELIEPAQTVASTKGLILPAANGTAGQVLSIKSVTGNNATLQWSAAAAATRLDDLQDVSINEQPSVTYTQVIDPIGGSVPVVTWGQRAVNEINYWTANAFLSTTNANLLKAGVVIAPSDGGQNYTLLQDAQATGNPGEWYLTTTNTSANQTWGGQTGSRITGQLWIVNTTALTDGEVLTWDNTIMKWVARVPSGGGGANITSPNNTITVTPGTDTVAIDVDTTRELTRIDNEIAAKIGSNTGAPNPTSNDYFQPDAITGTNLNPGITTSLGWDSLTSTTGVVGVDRIVGGNVTQLKADFDLFQSLGFISSTDVWDWDTVTWVGGAKTFTPPKAVYVARQQNGTLGYARITNITFQSQFDQTGHEVAQYNWCRILYGSATGNLVSYTNTTAGLPIFYSNSSAFVFQPDPANAISQIVLATNVAGAGVSITTDSLANTNTISANLVAGAGIGLSTATNNAITITNTAAGTTSIGNSTTYVDTQYAAQPTYFTTTRDLTPYHYFRQGFSGGDNALDGGFIGTVEYIRTDPTFPITGDGNGLTLLQATAYTNIEVDVWFPGISCDITFNRTPSNNGDVISWISKQMLFSDATCNASKDPSLSANLFPAFAAEQPGSDDIWMTGVTLPNLTVNSISGNTANVSFGQSQWRGIANNYTVLAADITRYFKPFFVLFGRTPSGQSIVKINSIANVIEQTGQGGIRILISLPGTGGATPSLNQVLSTGNTTGGQNIVLTSNSLIQGAASSYTYSDGISGQVLTKGSGNTVSWTTVSGGGGGTGITVPYIVFTSSATASANQVFTNTNISSYSNDATKAVVNVNGAALQPTTEYTISGNNLTIVKWLDANSIVSVEPMGTGSAALVDATTFISHRSSTVAYTGATNAQLNWGGVNATIDVNNIPDFTYNTTNGTFQNTATRTRVFQVEFNIILTGATTNIQEVRSWIQQGNLGDVTASSNNRYSFSVSRGWNSASAVASCRATVYLQPNQYMSTWAFFDQSGNVTGSGATNVFDIIPALQNRIVIKEIT